MTSDCLVFYHLPKSAGTTINQILRQNYRPEEMVECGPDTHAFVAEMQTWPAARWSGVRLLQGHFPFGVHELVPQPTRCFTMLRDPVERVVSYYYHARRDTNHYLHRLIHDNGWSLKDLLESGVALMMNDGQTRLLSAVWGDAPFDGVDASARQAALANLRACAAVGVTEQFDRSLLLFQHHFGWRHIGYTRANVGANREPTGRLNADTLATVRRYNTHDQALYDEAVRLLDEQTRAAGLALRLRAAVHRARRRPA